MSLYKIFCLHLHIILFSIWFITCLDGYTHNTDFLTTILLLDLILILFKFTVHCLPAWLEYITHYNFGTYVFSCARDLAFNLCTHWVALLTTPVPAYPGLAAWNIGDFLLLTIVRNRSMVILLWLVLFPVFSWSSPEILSLFVCI